MATESSVVRTDAENEEIVLARVDPATGDILTVRGSVKIRLADALGHEIKLRQVCVYDTDGTTRKTMIVLGSELYDT